MPNVIVDAHHHLWDLEKHYYPWLAAVPIYDSILGDYRPICRTYGVDDFLTDAAATNVIRSVHIQCDFDPTNPLGETEWLQAIADDHGFPHGIVASAHLADDNVEKLLEAHAQHANVRGIRQILNWHEDPIKRFADRPDYLTDSAWRRGFSLLARYDLSFDLQIYPSQMFDAAVLAADHPGTPVILNHAGMPLDRDSAGMAAWRDGMRALARQENVSVKVSGLGMLDHLWTVDTIRPIVLETVDVFGVERCMFGSNFPVDRLYGSYDAFVSAFDLITEAFTEGERAGLFADNATRIYRL